MSPKSASQGKRNFGATPVSRFIPQLTAEAMRKHGFMNDALLMNWRAIAGASLADHALPLKLVSANRFQKFAPDSGEGNGGQPGATLILKVNPALSLDVQYMTPQLIERINACLGYRAVSAIRLIQVPVAAQNTRKIKAQAGPLLSSTPVGESGEEDRLARALARLSAGRARKRQQFAPKANG